jgi:osmotically inducible protein OsmC
MIWCELRVAHDLNWATVRMAGATTVCRRITQILHTSMKRSASAVWQGSLKTGKGSITAPGGALKNTEYSFGSRFESGAGTNPEELIAAAHSGCFAMAFSATLGEAGITPERVDVTAEVSLDNVPPAGWTVTASHLILKAKVPGIDAAKFEELANKAKAGCPISRLLNAKITLSATLV